MDLLVTNSKYPPLVAYRIKKLSDVCSVSKAGSIHCSINPEERRMQVNCHLKLFSGVVNDWLSRYFP